MLMLHIYSSIILPHMKLCSEVNLLLTMAKNVELKNFLTASLHQLQAVLSSALSKVLSNNRKFSISVCSAWPANSRLHIRRFDYKNKRNWFSHFKEHGRYDISQLSRCGSKLLVGVMRKVALICRRVKKKEQMTESKRWVNKIQKLVEHNLSFMHINKKNVCSFQLSHFDHIWTNWCGVNTLSIRLLFMRNSVMELMNNNWLLFVLIFL
jgi:hypothetical protein